MPGGVGGLVVIAKARSAEATTVVLAVALVRGFVLPSLLEIDAVFSRKTPGGVDSFGFTSMVTVVVPPEAIVPRLAVTTPPEYDVVPGGGVVEDTYVTVLGKLSMIVTPVAGLGPLLMAVIV